MSNTKWDLLISGLDAGWAVGEGKDGRRFQGMGIHENICINFFSFLFIQS